MRLDQQSRVSQLFFLEFQDVPQSRHLMAHLLEQLADCVDLYVSAFETLERIADCHLFRGPHQYGSVHLLRRR